MLAVIGGCRFSTVIIESQLFYVNHYKLVAID